MRLPAVDLHPNRGTYTSRSPVGRLMGCFRGVTRGTSHHWVACHPMDHPMGFPMGKLNPMGRPMCCLMGPVGCRASWDIPWVPWGAPYREMSHGCRGMSRGCRGSHPTYHRMSHRFMNLPWALEVHWSSHAKS